jgi:hypothetical protein
LQEPAATEPLFNSHAAFWVQAFAEIGAVLLKHATKPLQERADTEPVLSRQACVPIQLDGGAAFAMPTACMTIAITHRLRLLSGVTA